MIKKLRLRLTLLYSVTIGLILIAVITGIAYYNYQNAKKKELEYFHNHLLSLSARLQSDITIPHSWLAQVEFENKLIINILDNQIPFRFHGSWQSPTDRSILISRLHEKAAAEQVFPDTKPVSSSLIKSSVFQIDGDYDDSYYGILVLMPTKSSYITLNLLSYIQPRSLFRNNEGITYLFLFLLGQSAIIIVSWYFIGRSMKPVEEATRKQHEFIAAASHELRSPLAVIQAGLSSLPPHEESKKTIETAQKECQRMTRLIADMLLLASSDAKTWSLHKEELDMDTILIDCYETFLPFAREKNLELKLDLPEQILPRIQGDRQRIDQILAILLDNAISYTPSGKQILIRAHSENHWLTVDIEDEGPGIADTDKDRIFDRFYRAQASRSDKKHFGLGLSIAKELTDLHNGRIQVQGSPSGGAVFSLHLRTRVRKHLH